MCVLRLVQCVCIGWFSVCVHRLVQCVCLPLRQSYLIHVGSAINLLLLSLLLLCLLVAVVESCAIITIKHICILYTSLAATHLRCILRFSKVLNSFLISSTRSFTLLSSRVCGKGSREGSAMEVAQRKEEQEAWAPMISWSSMLPIGSPSPPTMGCW